MPSPCPLPRRCRHAPEREGITTARSFIIYSSTRSSLIFKASLPPRCEFSKPLQMPAREPRIARRSTKLLHATPPSRYRPIFSPSHDYVFSVTPTSAFTRRFLARSPTPRHDTNKCRRFTASAQAPTPLCHCSACATVRPVYAEAKYSFFISMPRKRHTREKMRGMIKASKIDGRRSI